MPEEALSGKRVSEISISFMHEAAKGETIEGFFGKDGEDEDVYYVRTLRASDNNVNVEARIKLADIK